MKTIGEIKEEFSAAREADWNAICQMYETDLRSGVQKLVQQYRKKLDALEKEKLGDRKEQVTQDRDLSVLHSGKAEELYLLQHQESTQRN